MKTEQAASLLAATPLFCGLQRAELLALAEGVRPRNYPKNQFIFHQGDHGDALYVLVEGRVKVVLTSDEGNEIVLATLQPPEIFGELALIDEGARSASIQTLEPVTVLLLTRSTLLDLLRTNPAVADALLRSVGRLVRRMISQAADLVFLDLNGRVAKVLLRLIDDRGDAAAPVTLDLGMTHSDLAAMVGGSRQSVNQTLRQFERRGFVELRGRTVVVKDIAALRQRAGSPAWEYPASAGVPNR